jgi:hypothetical protein
VDARSTRSRRGNFTLAPEGGETSDPVDAARLRDAEAEWLTQWKPTRPYTCTGDGPTQAGALSTAIRVRLDCNVETARIRLARRLDVELVSKP